MGYLVNGSCALSLERAHDVHFSSTPRLLSSDTTYSYETVYAPSVVLGRSSDSGWTRVTTTFPIGGGSSVAVAYLDMPSQAFVTCDPAEAFIDGNAVGLLIFSAVICVAAVMFMREGIK